MYKSAWLFLSDGKPFEGNIAKGVLSQELLGAGKIEFPALTVEEIEDRSKAADGVFKNDRARLNLVVRYAVSCEKSSASRPHSY